MAFYIKPPSGTVSLNKLQNFVMKRLAFLYYIHNHSVEDVFQVIIRETVAMNSECLIEGTAKDKISHFTLRLLCISSAVLEDFFIQNETKLFSYRLQFCEFSRIQQMFRKASEQSKYVLRNNDYIFSSYEKVLKSFMIISEELDFTIKENKNFIKVPFTAALKFVKERSHPLHLGYLNVPLNDLNSLCISLFEELLGQGVNQVRKSRLKKFEDPRMFYLSQKIMKWIHSKLLPVKIPNNKITNGCNLMTISKKFPLCMQNLHNLLLKHHRLKHVSRIQFTLFLKEIGVSSNDVIKLFMKEYSKPLTQTCDLNHAPCSHNWTQNEKRYIYSIEHLYGMRGARTNYTAHSCVSLQNSYDSEGGCPFVSFDSQHLQRILKNENFMLKDIEDVASLAQGNKYHEACSFYLMCKINMHNKNKSSSNNFPTLKETNSCINNSECHDFSSNEQNASDSLLPLSSLCIRKPSDFYAIVSTKFGE